MWDVCALCMSGKWEMDPTCACLLLHQIRDAPAFITKRRRAFPRACLPFIIKQDVHIGALAECSYSSFALVVSCVQVRIFFLLPVMPTRNDSGRSKQMRVGCHTGIHRLGVPVEIILF
jgi:hypothetical protein